MYIEKNIIIKKSYINFNSIKNIKPFFQEDV